MPVVLPTDQISGDLELICVDWSPLTGQLDVLKEEVIRVHSDCGRGILQRRHRQRAGLRMIRRSPRPLAANVVNNVSVLLPLIRNRKDVRHWRCSATADTTRTPRLGFPCRKGPVFLNSDFYLRVNRRPRTGDHQFSIAFVEHLYRLSTGLFGQTSSGDVPLIRSELASEPAADVILLNANVGRGNL